MYYIYHVPGIKIGCTINPKRRIINQQGYKSYEILEQHEDVYIANTREKELKIQYGYNIDKKDYIQCNKMRSNITQESKHGLKLGSKKGGMVTGKLHVESGLLERIRSIEKLCPYCNRIIKGPNYNRWHGDKCKAKP